MSVFKKIFSLCVMTAALGLAGCGEFENISASQFGDKWPFTVDSGTLECTHDGTLLFHAGGVTYTLYAPRENPGNAILTDTILKHPDERPSYGDGVGPVIDQGLDLCKEP